MTTNGDASYHRPVVPFPYRFSRLPTLASYSVSSSNADETQTAWAVAAVIMESCR